MSKYDLNGDGLINIKDLITFIKLYDSINISEGDKIELNDLTLLIKHIYVDGNNYVKKYDVNNDGVINIKDIIYWIKTFNKLDLNSDFVIDEKDIDVLIKVIYKNSIIEDTFGRT